MKKIATVILFISLIIIGCGAHRTTPVENISHKDFKLIEDKEAGLVYLSPDFNFKGYETIILTFLPLPSNIHKTDIDPEEMKIYFIKQMEKNLQSTGLFVNVVDELSSSSEKYKLAGKTIILESSFSELDPGNRALRWVVGFGAGATKVQVELEIKEPNTKRILYKSSDRRIGFMGGFGGDSKDFITSSLTQISEGQTSFMKRISSGGKIEK